MLSPDYRDLNGNDRRAVVRLVQFSLFRYKSVHLFSLTKSLEILDEDNAVAEVLVAMAGKPVETAEQLFDLRADLVRFNVRYVRRGRRVEGGRRRVAACHRGRFSVNVSY